jgi:hypothetical protein
MENIRKYFQSNYKDHIYDHTKAMEAKMAMININAISNLTANFIIVHPITTTSKIINNINHNGRVNISMILNNLSFINFAARS